MEEDANDKDLVNNVIHDYEKLLKEECDCTKRIIPGMTEVKSFTHHLISYLCSTFVFVTFIIKFS